MTSKHVSNSEVRNSYYLWYAAGLLLAVQLLLTFDLVMHLERDYFLLCIPIGLIATTVRAKLRWSRCASDGESRRVSFEWVPTVSVLSMIIVFYMVRPTVGNDWSTSYLVARLQMIVNAIW